MLSSMRDLIRIVEGKVLFEGVHIPRKFWLNPDKDLLFPCSDHASDVLENWQEMGISEDKVKEWQDHLNQWSDDEDEMEDALDENAGSLLSLAMDYGWIRGGVYSEVFLQHDDMNLLRKGVKYMRDMYHVNLILIGQGHDEWERLEGNGITQFIRTGLAP